MYEYNHNFLKSFKPLASSWQDSKSLLAGRDHLSTLPWIGCDPGLECDVWTQFSNSIRHTLPAQLLACLSASPDRLTPTNSGNFLHLGLLRGSTTITTGPDTIALNGILCSTQIGCTLWSGFSCRDIWCRTVVTHFGLDQLTGVTWQKSQDLNALWKSINFGWYFGLSLFHR